MSTLLKSAPISPNGLSKKPQVDNKVLTTRDYKIFKSISGNRVVDAAHVNRIKESMKEHDLMIPIICNENLEVIDGQHRLQARQELNLPVYYVTITGLTITDTQKANVNNKNWVAPDFLNFYVKQNYYHYKVFKQFQEKYQFNVQITLGLLSGSQTLTVREFRDGLFTVANLEKAQAIADKIYDLQHFYKGFKRRSFVFAMVIALKNEAFDWEEFLGKVSYQSSKLVDCTSIDQYLLIIEDIYNYKRKTDDKIRFK